MVIIVAVVLLGIYLVAWGFGFWCAYDMEHNCYPRTNIRRTQKK